VWVSDDVLVRWNVEPWVGLPLWLPDSEPDAAGFLRVDCEHARRAGLSTRPLIDTVGDTAQLLGSRDNASAWKLVLSGARERQILQAIAAAGGAAGGPAR
jgi:2'-hydroxyisoflavone reductase